MSDLSFFSADCPPTGATSIPGVRSNTNAEHLSLQTLHFKDTGQEG